MNYNVVLVEVLRDLHTGQHACTRTTYVSSMFAHGSWRHFNGSYGLFVVRQKTARLCFVPLSPGSPLDLLTIFKSSLKNKTHVFMGIT